MRPHDREIENRLAALTASWSPRLAAAFADYRRTLPGIGASNRQRGPSPYWLRLPGWLLSSVPPAHEDSARPRAVPLADLLWAQFCLYLSVRVRDDLFDGQTSEPLLHRAAQELLREAERTVSATTTRAAGRELGRFLRKVLRTTREAILEVDALQRSRSGMPEDSLPLYARVGEIFQFGSWAVLHSLARRDLFAPVSDCCDHLAMGLQIVDDLRDLEEDLARGRLNYVASLLLGSDRESVDPLQARPLVAERLSVERGLERVCGRVRCELRAAGRALETVPLGGWLEYLGECLARIDALESELHRARVDALFGG